MHRTTFVRPAANLWAGKAQLRQQLLTQVSEVSLALGLDSKKGWPPELLDVPGKFYLRARSQGLNRPRPARGYLATTAQVHQLAAHHAHTLARLDRVSAQAAAHHPAAHPRPGDNQPPLPSGGGHANSVPPGPGGWAAGEAGDGDPEVARLLAVLANAGPAGLTVPELVAATGRQKTWIFDRLGDLQQAGLVKRAGQGSYPLLSIPCVAGEPGRELPTWRFRAEFRGIPSHSAVRTGCRRVEERNPRGIPWNRDPAWPPPIAGACVRTRRRR